MRKAKDMLGKPVVRFDTGERRWRVRDVLISDDGGRFLGLLVREGAWLTPPVLIPMDRIQALGPDAVVVPSKDAFTTGQRIPELKSVLRSRHALVGTRLLTTDGKALGTIADLYFDEKTGAVQGYEVSGGLWADTYTGRSFVPAVRALKLGRDVAFVSPEVVEEIRAQIGGIKGAMQSAASRAQETASDAGTRLQESAAVARERFQEGAAVARERIRETAQDAGARLRESARSAQERADASAEAAQQRLRETSLAARRRWEETQLSMAERMAQEAAGRHALRTLYADDGTVIVAEGQLVTPAAVERARTEGKAPELLEATGLTPREYIAGRTDTTLSATGSRFRTGAGEARSAAENLWGQAQREFQEMRERAARWRRETRIKAAVGRPVNRVILDHDDSVILNTGELITFEAVERARSAGVLDILLDSVHLKEPEIPVEQVRAPEPGEASLQARRERSLR